MKVWNDVTKGDVVYFCENKRNIIGVAIVLSKGKENTFPSFPLVIDLKAIVPIEEELTESIKSQIVFKGGLIAINHIGRAIDERLKRQEDSEIPNAPPESSVAAGEISQMERKNIPEELAKKPTAESVRQSVLDTFDLEEAKERLTTLITQGRIEHAMKQEDINFYIKRHRTDLKLALMGQQSYYELIQDQMRNGLVSVQDGLAEQRRIINNLLQIIERL